MQKHGWSTSACCKVRKLMHLLIRFSKGLESSVLLLKVERRLAGACNVVKP